MRAPLSSKEAHLFYYFDFKVWFKLLRLIAKEPNQRQRRGLYKLLLLHIPLRATVTAVCFFLDGIVFPGLWRTRVHKPVFIIGHARSGTTLAHRLMSADERFSVFKYYELLLPSLLQKKLVRAAAWIDAHLLGAAVFPRVAWRRVDRCAGNLRQRRGSREREDGGQRSEGTPGRRDATACRRRSGSR